MVVRVRELERRAGEDEGLARCDDVSSGGVDRPPWLPVKKRHLAASERGFFPLPPLRDLPVWSSGGLSGGQRRRLLRDVNGAFGALNWMHGEDSRPTTRPPSLVASEDKNQSMSSC